MMLSDVSECVRGSGRRREYKIKGTIKEKMREERECKKRRDRNREIQRERAIERQVPKKWWPKATSLPLSGTEVVQMIED